MSHIISNPHVEDDMTNKLVCVIYYRERINLQVTSNGMDPFEIWDILKYEAFDEQVVPVILDRLIYNNIERNFVSFNAVTKKISLTEQGRNWAEVNCGRFAGVT
jgi:hypothetical protein